jgi:hypothetical protein
MTRDELVGAFVAWHLAIECELRFPGQAPDLKKHALQYGRDVTNPESIDVVAAFFNFDKIEEAIRSTNTVDGDAS